jgi:hypothetical protein
MIYMKFYFLCGGLHVLLYICNIQYRASPFIPIAVARRDPNLTVGRRASNLISFAVSQKCYEGLYCKSYPFCVILNKR